MVSEVENDPLLGTVLSEKYQLVRVVGSGGFARVYEARQASLDRTVAVKILLPEWRANPHCIEKLTLEAKATSYIEHPNTVQVLDFAAWDGMFYLVMELVRGRSMRREMESGPVALDRALGWCDQILAAAGAAHRAGVVHGDLKPNNVLIETLRSGGERLKLIDFGTSPTGQNAVIETVCGTPQYMAPELSLGHPATAASDVYAAGVMLYELIAGCVPFQGKTPVETMKMHLECSVPRASDRGAPPALSAIAERALSKSPCERYASADEMRRALKAAAATLGDVSTLHIDRPAAFAEGSGSIAEPTNAFGLSGLERAIGKAIRAGRVVDLPRLYERRSELLFKTGHVTEAIAELEEGLCVITGGGDAVDTSSGPRDLWRLLHRLALLYRMTGCRRRARHTAESALRHATAAADVVGRRRAAELCAELRALPAR